MRKILALILYFLFRRKIIKLSKREDVVLTIYGHNTTKDTFEKLIKWLLNHKYQFITPNELMLFKEGKLGKNKTVWLSFDDGWKNNYYEILPIIEKYKIPATFFISTQAIEDGYFWFTHVYENRKSNLFKEVGDLWIISNEERKKIIKNLPKYQGNRVAMNVHELKLLSQSPYVTIANHTNDHVICDKCKENELIEEILLCESKIEKFTGEKCGKIFSYPNGNYDENAIYILKGLNYKIAATTNIGVFHRNTNLFKIPRTEFKNNASLYENILQIYGIWTPFFNKIKSFVHIKNKK